MNVDVEPEVRGRRIAEVSDAGNGVAAPGLEVIFNPGA
jgi:hypothetical protein